MFIFSPQVIELEDAVPPSELHLDQALEEQERLDRFNIVLFCKPSSNTNTKLDPVGSTVRYEMMKLCTGSVLDPIRQWQLVIKI